MEKKTRGQFVIDINVCSGSDNKLNDKLAMDLAPSFKNNKKVHDRFDSFPLKQN